MRDIQTHKHCSTCKKKGHSICRFHFPKPPMRRTIILMPLQEQFAKEFKTLQDISHSINKHLQHMGLGMDMSFDEFLTMLQLNEQTYLHAIRSTIQQTTLFLKCEPRDIRTNNFNQTLARLWQANTDIQYILEPYAAASYCTSYLTKMDNTITAALHEIIKNNVQNPTNDCDQIRKLGNAFLNAQQMPTQESKRIMAWCCKVPCQGWLKSCYCWLLLQWLLFFTIMMLLLMTMMRAPSWKSPAYGASHISRSALCII
ncbi:hypothetical protein O6H91_14G076700 [Diphasiastrum complanatum]|uniref:Uncharacterized protein n=1 Tax=Diphasiastrum complanatum TaxID=34168 RepID=A0ACC2BS00_DIPCM|nr:hypothetical protein O6H91_14G076700 [Diphasiastrum complanatum]